jgi:hypothetical protein
MNFILEEVITPNQEKTFLRMPFRIYKKDPNWVPHLEKDIKDVFDRGFNPYFETGDARRWILKVRNKCVGRIAAFYNTKYYDQTGQKIGGMGFFECINNKEAAKTLFDVCEKWLKKNGALGMDGPVNFGEKDRFWGLMVSGFKNPSYLEGYNPPYYRDFFESFGFVKNYEQSTSEITREDFNYDRFSKIASRVLNNPSYRFEHYKADEVERFAADFVTIYNQGWQHRPDFTEMTMERVLKTLKALKPILMEEIIWFAYANNEPAGFYINTIDVNQIFKHMRGRMDIIDKLKFLWFRKFGNINRVRGIVFGVVPKYQNHGLETGMIMKFHDAVRNHKKIRSSELAWIGDFNPKMHSLFEALGAKTTKVHITYRKLFA